MMYYLFTRPWRDSILRPFACKATPSSSATLNPRGNRSCSLGVCGPGFGLEAGLGAWLWIGLWLRRLRATPCVQRAADGSIRPPPSTLRGILCNPYQGPSVGPQGASWHLFATCTRAALKALPGILCNLCQGPSVGSQGLSAQ